VDWDREMDVSRVQAQIGHKGVSYVYRVDVMHGTHSVTLVLPEELRAEHIPLFRELLATAQKEGASMIAGTWQPTEVPPTLARTKSAESKP
jgi:hypothetical protein